MEIIKTKQIRRDGKEISTGQILTILKFTDSTYKYFIFEFADGTQINPCDPDSPFCHIVGSDEGDTIYSFLSNSVVEGMDGDDIIIDSKNGNTIYGGAGNDQIDGGAGNDIIFGDEGNDIIYGGTGADIIDGGPGDDILYGEDGNDTYIFGKESGNDVISDLSGLNTVKFTDISPDDISLHYSSENNDVVLTVISTGQTLTIQNFTRFKSKVYNKYIFEFSDGTQIKPTDPDSIFRCLTGTDGDDIIYGGDQDDTINGGAGNDILNGGYGNDTYIFGKESGNDTIKDSSGTNTIKFVDFMPDDITVNYSTKTEEAVLTVHPTGQTLTIEGFTSSSNYRNFILEFADGSAMNLDDEYSIFRHVTGTNGDDSYIESFFSNSVVEGLDGDDVINDCDYGSTIFGGAGNDIIKGNGGDDIIDGGAGDDILYGGKGNDTYIFGKESGNDTIIDSNGNSTIKFTDILPNEISVNYSSKTKDLVLTVQSTGQNLTIQKYASSSKYGKYILEFSDGSSAHINYLSNEIIIDKQGTEMDDNAYEINNTSDVLSSLYSDETTENISDNNEEILISNMAASSYASEKTVFDKTDIQLMILSENMASFGTEENVFNNSSLFANDYNDLSDQMLISSIEQ